MRSCCGRLLGRTFFEYVDEVEDVLLEMVRDYRLQARYFKLLARELENRETNRNPTSEPNNIDATGMTLDQGMLSGSFLVESRCYSSKEGREGLDNVEFFINHQ